MIEEHPDTRADPEESPRWRLRLGGRLGTRLILFLLPPAVLVFALMGYLNIRLHRQHLEAATLASAERVSDVIKRSTSYSMLRNDREGLYHMISTLADEPGMVRIRVFNQEGKISYSTQASEVGSYVDKGAEACYACHSQTSPLERLNRPDRFRIFTPPSGDRVLGIITPVENRPECSAAPCHAHPKSQKILGVLDVNLSLVETDRGLAESTRWMSIHTLGAVAALSLLIALLIWRLVHGPLLRLKAGTERLRDGELGYQILLNRPDELGELATSFNQMSRQLHEEHEQNEQWTKTLEERVNQKTSQLRKAHESMLQVEKMASIGKLGAIVAHEINNPLAGILTYAKLLKKWTSKEGVDHARHEQIRSSLDLIESESRRCGDIVKNLLMFARAAPINLDWAQLNQVIRRCVQLVQHQAEVNNVQLEMRLDEDLPRVRCDPAQIQQVMVALVMNAIEATPHGHAVYISSAFRPLSKEVELRVQDEGAGIPEELLPRLFEPFFTTKEAGRGVGLGLAVSHSIVERHGGRIIAESSPGGGAIFTIRLSLEGSPTGGEIPTASTAPPGAERGHRT